MTLFAQTFLRQLFGLDSETIPSDARLEYILTNQPQSWRVFVLIAVVAALVYLIFRLYRREIDSCPRWAKLALAGVRTAVVVLLVLIYLGPAVTYSQRRTLQPQVVLMRDASQSMNVRDRYLSDADVDRLARALGRSPDEIRDQRPSRAELVNTFLSAGGGRLLAELQQRGKLRVADFSGRVVPVETRPAIVDSQASRFRRAPPDSPQSSRSDGGDRPEADASGSPVEPLPPLAPEGQATDIGRAIRDAVREKHTAAAVIFTDGRHTASGDPREAAELARENNVKLLIVGVGDPQRPRNLSIVELYADPRVFKGGDPFEIRGVVRGQGLGERTVEVELIERRMTGDGGGDDGQVIDRQPAEITADGKPAVITFRREPKIAGRFAYEIRVPPVENEVSEEDNRSDAPVEVNVVDRKPRVLLVAGSPTWEYRGVQRLLQNEESVVLSCWLQTIDEDRAQDGDVVINHLPATQKELFEYDVILLFDPDPARDLTPQWSELLKKFVAEHSGGLLYMAGPKFSGRFLSNPRTGEIRDILPVRMGDVEAIDAALHLAGNTRAWSLDVVPANVDRPIMRLNPDPTESLRLWREMPGIYWSFPSQEPQPAARVLLEHSDPTLRTSRGPRPLLVTGKYGLGNTIFMGFNGTWRWRRMGENSEFFNRFWIQTVRYLEAGRTLEGKRRGQIETDRDNYELGESIEIIASRVTDDSFNLLTTPELKVLHTIDGVEAKPLVLRAVENQPGQYSTTLIARNTGRHHLAIVLGGSATSAVTIETNFRVSLPTVEMNETHLNKALLRDLAESSGGRYFEIDELDQLPAEVPNLVRTVEVKSKPTPLWDTWLALGLLVGLLCVEWAARKAFKLL